MQAKRYNRGEGIEGRSHVPIVPITTALHFARSEFLASRPSGSEFQPPLTAAPASLSLASARNSPYPDMSASGRLAGLPPGVCHVLAPDPNLKLENHGRMNLESSHDAIDVRFPVEFRHQLRFTTDVLGADGRVLRDLLEASEGTVPKVQFWVDQQVADANPELSQRIQEFCRSNRERISLAGNLQFVPGGEDVKNDIHIIERMLKCFNHADLDRRSYVVVIGGGAVLDAVGFAAAIAHRGIRLVRIPTTTLAQADSGIGVKNSINLFQKKNWVGTFAVPWAVINDGHLLNTLSDRDFRCGFSEAVKVSLLKDAGFFQEICENAEAIRDRESVSSKIIRESARWHLRHITAGGDPFESLEARPLDFGHWSAHKLEAMTNFDLRHGEAVAIGVVVDTIYSGMAHGLNASVVDQVVKCMDDLGILLNHPALSRMDELLAGLEEFRQHLGGRLTVTMLRDAGDPIDVHEIDHRLMRQAIEEAVERVTAVSGG